MTGTLPGKSAIFIFICLFVFCKLKQVLFCRFREPFSRRQISCCYHYDDSLEKHWFEHVKNNKSKLTLIDDFSYIRVNFGVYCQSFEETIHDLKNV